MIAYDSPEEFLRVMDTGKLDGHLQEELEKLPYEFLVEVALLRAKTLRNIGWPSAA